MSNTNGTTYPGGKGGSGVWQTLLNEIPPHDEYIAAFAGFDALARHMKRAERVVLIDLDRAALTTLADALGNPRRGVELFNADGMAWLLHRFDLERMAPQPPRFRLPTIPIGEQPFDRVFVYLDPPYPHSTRVKTRLYENEMTDGQHSALLHIARRLPCPCMVSSYPNAAYDTALTGWRSFDFEATTRGATMRTERVWMNYPTPGKLHDSRHVGGEKRERERVRRRVRNWLAGLDRAGPRERQAILDAIAERFPQMKETTNER